MNVSQFSLKVGFDISETGVGPYNHLEDKDYIEVKAYYQWVPFVLFLQAIMFYIPHIIFKYFEGGKIKLVIAGKISKNMKKLPLTKSFTILISSRTSTMGFR